MKRYRSHKIVEAGVIAQVCEASIENEEPFVLLRDGTTVFVPSDFLARGAPQFGDYLVRYDGDYLSWSPKSVFEAGYTELTAAKPARLDIAKALRDAYGRGFAVGTGLAGTAGERLMAPPKREECDAWIAQYMARLSAFQDEAVPVTRGQWRHVMDKELTQVDDVTVTVSAPPGKRAVVVIVREDSKTVQTLTGGQSHSFALSGKDEMNIAEGQPHSTVADQGE